MRRLECISTDTQNVMADPLDFRVSDLELRVIRNASESGFLIPYYLKYNDSYAFVYNFEGYANLVDSLKSIGMDKWRTCMLSLFDCIEIIENNGFLNSCNLCLESDYVYFNPADQKVKLIYLPVENNFFFTDINEFTNTLRLFIRTTGENTGLLDSNTKAVLADSNSDIARLKKAVEDFRPFQNNVPAEPAKKNGILSSLGFKKSADTKKKPVKSSSPVIHVQGGATEILDEGIAGIALVYKGNDYPLRIEIKNGDCIIGKQKESVDQVIPFSKAVSRVHCKVMFDKGDAGITDLGSSNGTFVNGKRLDKDEVVSIKAGDKIKIANLDFEVEDIKL